MGHEFVGCIDGVGDGVEGWQIGETVVSETAFSVCGRCAMCRTGHDNVCADKELIGYVHDGAFARYVVVPSRRLHRVPATVRGMELALAEPLAGCTHAMIEQVEILPGDVVVLLGAGTVGLISLQIAKMLGATVILCGRSPHRLTLGQELGADYVIDLNVDEPQSLVSELSAGRGCDVFVECSGTPDAATLGVELLRRRGRLLLQGLVGTPVTFGVDEVAYKELIVTGTMGQKWSAWERAMKLLGTGVVKLRPIISDVLPLSEWRHGFHLVETRSRQKILLQPTDND
jgi:L-iditol 2-dehydrogenase